MLSLRFLVAAAVGVVAAQAATVTFDCTKVPNICSNDCYAIKCLGQPTTLHRNSAQATANRNNNACRSPNRCSGNPDDSNSCDEYPFASTSEGGAGAATRCVPAHENSVQGGTLSSFYTRSAVAQGDAYNVAFTSTSGLQYCNSVCTNSGNELVRRSPVLAQRNGISLHKERLFRLADGKEMLMFESLAAPGSLNTMVGDSVDVDGEQVVVVEEL